MRRSRASFLVSLAALVLGTASVRAAAQQEQSDPLVGTWAGALALPSGSSLNVVFHLKAKGNGLSGTMDSPDQGATGIPLNEVSRIVAKVHFGVSAIQGAFDGTLSGDRSSITGTWSQGAISLPVVLKRVAAERGEPSTSQAPHTATSAPSGLSAAASGGASAAASDGASTDPSAVQWQPIVEMGGELFPAFVLATATMNTQVFTGGPRMIQSGSYFGDGLGLIGVQVTAPHAGARLRVEITVPGVAATSEQDAVLSARGQTYELFPRMLYDYTALHKVRQPMPAHAHFRLFVDGKLVGSRSEVIRVRSVNDAPFAWTTRQGQRLSLSWMFAAFVNEDAPQVDSLLSAALKTPAIQQFTGYQLHSAAAVQQQVYAIWHVLERKGFRYSNITTPSAYSATVSSQHVRFLGDALRVSEANCVDGSVLFASVLRKIGIDPFLVMIPGHMMVGFYLNPQHSAYSVLETTMMGAENLRRGSITGALNNLLGESARLYNAAIADGNRKFDGNRQKFGRVPGYLVIDIGAARRKGIMPIQ